MIGIVYMLYNPNVPNRKYIGSTTQTLKHRYSAHKASVKNGKSPLYRAMREDGDIGLWLIETLKEAEIESKAELYKWEADFIKNVNSIEAGLNRRVPARTPTQLYVDKRDEILEKRKQYYKDNCDMIKRKNLARYHKKKVAVADENV